MKQNSRNILLNIKLMFCIVLYFKVLYCISLYCIVGIVHKCYVYVENPSSSAECAIWAIHLKKNMFIYNIHFEMTTETVDVINMDINEPE